MYSRQLYLGSTLASTRVHWNCGSFIICCLLLLHNVSSDYWYVFNVSFHGDSESKIVGIHVHEILLPCVALVATHVAFALETL